jgi:hypothetical protein
MAQLMLLQIQSLHARSVQEAGLIVRIGGIAIETGPIVAILDGTAVSPANTALLDLDTGKIRLKWGVIATLPFMADAFASGAIAPAVSAPVQVTLDEHGHVLGDGNGFDVQGTGNIVPGSILSGASVPTHQNLVSAPGIAASLAAGDTAICTFAPESSVVQVKLPRALGGGTQSLNLTGGFLLVPLMTLEPRERSKRRRR